MQVCIIGGGVIGVTTAWQLALRGARVSLVEACGQVAALTSHANGGQLSYSYVAPLAEPGVLPRLPAWLLRRDSPLRFRPRLDPLQWRWGLAFLRACTTRQAAASTAQVLGLAALSRATLQAWMQAVALDFHHAGNGKLIVYRHPGPLDKARAQVRLQAELGGARQAVLSADACVALEPALKAVAGDLAGGLHTPSEESGDCRLFTQRLFEHWAARSGQSAWLGSRALGFRREGRRVRALRLDDGREIEADQFVVAGGLGSRALLGTLGYAPLLYGLKGYSLTVQDAADCAPAISVTDYERRTVYVRLGDALRVSAMVGMGLDGLAPEPDRIAQVRREAGEFLPQADFGRAQAWAGQRPATPHGRPLIGRCPGTDNVWLNTGHGALGFTLACGSASLLDGLMAGERPALDPAPFAPH
ncbi:D-amino acid dehydrogenase [Castellaniella sp.]|uniref:D-amino acid dehydrogenase n=1 Tax=Castellaniella sp. TaxID=1955812 RepID=UPI003560AE25